MVEEIAESGWRLGVGRVAQKSPRWAFGKNSFANRRGSSQAGATAAAASTARRGRHELEDDDDSDDEAPPKRYLNGRITKLHNVRAEPIRDAKVVGYLVATKEVTYATM